jgi:Exodeoxyribonuclease III (EC 3.1.11.2)
VKIISFNINGIRARLHQLQALIEKHQPDVIGLQETKVHDDAFPLADVEAMGYEVHFHGQKPIMAWQCCVRSPPSAYKKALPLMTKTLNVG